MFKFKTKHNCLLACLRYPFYNGLSPYLRLTNGKSINMIVLEHFTSPSHQIIKKDSHSSLILILLHYSIRFCLYGLEEASWTFHGSFLGISRKLPRNLIKKMVKKTHFFFFFDERLRRPTYSFHILTLYLQVSIFN